MLGKHVVHENVEWSDDQATVVIRINADQWNLTAVEHFIIIVIKDICRARN